MNYIKMFGFYGCEVVGTLINFGGAIFGYYPCVDLGIKFLLFVESNRIDEERQVRFQDREEKEEEASSMHKEAKENG